MSKWHRVCPGFTLISDSDGWRAMASPEAYEAFNVMRAAVEELDVPYPPLTHDGLIACLDASRAAIARRGLSAVMTDEQLRDLLVIYLDVACKMEFAPGVLDDGGAPR
jgi:hypothetical protein